MSYQFKSRIRYSEVGEDRKLTLPGVIDYFQDCSTFQSEELGVGFDALGKMGKAWVLAYWHIVFNRMPGLGEEVTVQTWPYYFRGFYGERNFRMLDAAGETLAYANSLWIYLDVESGHPHRVTPDIISAYQMEEALPMEKTSRKIAVPDGSKRRESFVVVKSNLDTNHHVNNGQYIAMAEEYLPQGFAVQQVRVEYKKSAVLHDVIVPLVDEKKDICTVSLCDGEEKPFAVVEFKAKP